MRSTNPRSNVPSASSTSTRSSQPCGSNRGGVLEAVVTRQQRLGLIQQLGLLARIQPVGELRFPRDHPLPGPGDKRPRRVGHRSGAGSA